MTAVPGTHAAPSAYESLPYVWLRPRASRYAGQSTNVIALVSMRIPGRDRPKHPPIVAGSVLQATDPAPRRHAAHKRPADR